MLPNVVQVTKDERPILVASTGGHLEQMYLWATRWGLLGGGATWVTFSNDQSRSLLQNEDVEFIPYVAPRDLMGAIRSASLVTRIASRHNAHTIVSTGAAVGVSAALAGLRGRRRVVYIESLARVSQLSMTGKILAPLPGIEKYVQSEQLASRRFSYGGTILDDFDASFDHRTFPAPKKVLVTIGTIRPYGFDRAIEQLSPLLQDCEVTWQIGEHTVSPGYGDVHSALPRKDLERLMRDADVVICHSGVGSILSALKAGKTPVVVPRLAKFAEHVDDHQVDIAEYLASRSLVIYRPNSAVTQADLNRAQSGHVRLPQDEVSRRQSTACTLGRAESSSAVGD